MADTTDTASAGPLRGLRVLDLIDDLGAYGPRLLCGMGAEVIRLEPPAGSRHRARRAPTSPWLEHHGLDGGLYFLHYNAGKRGITLEPEHPAGRELLLRLLDRVDVVLDNGELRRWGIDIDALVAKPRPLTVVSVTPFGLSGPRAGWEGCDLICQAMSGMLGLYGYHGERPARFSPEQGSEIAGLAAALGALIGRYGARRTGRGDHMDIAVERVCALVTLQMQNASLFHQFGFVRPRAERGVGSPPGLYEASDGFVAFNPWRDAEATVGLLEECGAHGIRVLFDSIPREEFSSHPAVVQAVHDFTSCRTRAEVAELVQARGLLGMPVNDVVDVMHDPFLVGRSFFVEIDANGTSLVDTGIPIRFGATPARLGARPPLLGEDNEEIYGELGLSRDEIAKLRAEATL